LKIPRCVLLLLGGGLGICQVMTDTGLAVLMGSARRILLSVPVPVLLFVPVAFVMLTTELISNVATDYALGPVIASLALTGDMDPILLLLPVAMPASCALMLPIATGANAIAFSSGEMSLPRRTDEVTEGNEAERVLANAPERHDGYFVVPRVVE